MMIVSKGQTEIERIRMRMMAAECIGPPEAMGQMGMRMEATIARGANGESYRIQEYFIRNPVSTVS